MTMALLDWSQCPAVESTPDKVSGAWVLRHTRMPVATIFENLEAGANIDDILAWYDGLDRDQVKAVIEFAARGLDTPVSSAHSAQFEDCRLVLCVESDDLGLTAAEQLRDAVGSDVADPTPNELGRR